MPVDDKIESMPVEIRIEKVRQETINAINTIGVKYDMPGILMALVIQEISLQAKIDGLENIVSYFELGKDNSNDDKIDTKSDVSNK